MAAKPAAARNAAFCLALITGVVSDESPAAAEIRFAFRLAFIHEGRGALEDAKSARLELAKLIAQSEGLAWPQDLTDEDARELVWNAHQTKPDHRGKGLAGSRDYFRNFFEGRNAKLREKLGPVLTKTLLRRGVLGTDASFVAAISANPADHLPRLVYADFLEENGRPNAASALRLSVRLEDLPATRENFTERARVEKQLREVRWDALQEWNEGPLGAQLSDIGRFTSLSAEGMPVLRASFERLMTATPEQRAAITGLNLRNSLRRADLQPLADLTFPNVLELNLGDNRLGDDNITFLSHVKAFPKVTALLLDDNAIEPGGAEALARSRNYPHVRHLDLNGNWIRDDGALALAQSTAFPELQRLELVGNEIHASGAASLAGSTNFGKVTTLNLRGNSISSSGAAALANGTAFRNVLTLDLAGNFIPVDGVQALATGPAFGKVTSLNLRLNRFGNPGARALQDGTTFRGLTHIDLEDTYAGEDVIESVTQTLMTPRR